MIQVYINWPWNQFFVLDKIADSTYYTGIQVRKLTKKHVKEQLETHGILKDNNTNKKDLVKELEIALAEETLMKISGT